MTMHKALHPRDDIDRLYVSRKGVGRGLASIEDSFDASRQKLEDYIEKRGGKLITATRNNIYNMRINRTEITTKQKWEEKQLYVCFKRLTSDISHEKTGTWLRKGNLTRETQSLLSCRKQRRKQRHKDQSYKARIDKTQQNSKCRLCGDRDETISPK